MVTNQLFGPWDYVVVPFSTAIISMAMCVSWLYILGMTALSYKYRVQSETVVILFYNNTCEMKMNPVQDNK